MVANDEILKLVELFEIMTDTVELRKEEEEQLVQLTRGKIVIVVGEQVENMVRASEGKSLPLVMMEEVYRRMFREQLPLVRLGVGSVEQLVELLHLWVRQENKMVTTVEEDSVTDVKNLLPPLIREKR